jgi:hypothetical protein
MLTTTVNWEDASRIINTILYQLSKMLMLEGTVQIS